MPSVTTRSRVSRRKTLLEPDLPPHFPADWPPAFLGYPLRNRADGDPAGLQQDHRTGIGQRRRNARGLAGAGKGRNYYGPFSRKRFPDPRPVGHQLVAALKPRSSSTSGGRPRRANHLAPLGHMISCTQASAVSLIQLDEETYRKLREQAFRQERSVSSVVREMVARGLDGPQAPNQRRVIGHFLSVRAGRSKQPRLSPVSERHDEALSETFDK